jgi:hypothetical protein
MPTSFIVGSTKMLRDGRYQVLVTFVQRSTLGVMRWWDAAIVGHEGDRLVIDNRAESDGTLQTLCRLPRLPRWNEHRRRGLCAEAGDLFGCQGRHWVSLPFWACFRMVVVAMMLNGWLAE